MTYPEMKDSGVPWIGRMPAHWTTIDLKYLFAIKKDIAGELGHTVLSITQQGIKPKNMSDKGQFAQDYSKYQLVNPGDFAMNHMDLLTGWVDISKFSGVTSPDYRVFRTKKPDSIYPDFFKYIFQAGYMCRIFYGLGQGVAGFGRWRLPSDMFLNFPLPVPPLDEQERIALKLDKICDTIDSLVQEAEYSIEEYKCWKASVIYQAVTKGLDPNTEMKDSGVPWIGLTPKDWSIRRLKWVLSQPLQYGANETGLDYNPSFPRYIRITDITSDGKLTSSEMQSLDEDVAAPYILRDEDILLARSGATVGKAFFYRAQYGKAAFAGYLIRATVNRQIVLPKYVYYSTLSSGYESWKASTSIQATIQNISANRYNNYALAFPSLKEQRKLVDYLDSQCTNIDTIISEKQSLISELEAYKKSLIYEAVTGKRKVE